MLMQVVSGYSQSVQCHSVDKARLHLDTVSWHPLQLSHHISLTSLHGTVHFPSDFIYNLYLYKSVSAIPIRNQYIQVMTTWRPLTVYIE